MTSGVNSNKAVVKTVFLYFFELLGLDDKDILESLLSQLLKLKKESEVEKMLRDLKIDENIVWDKAQLLPLEKEGLNHKKFFKRFCKLFVTNQVDNFPARDGVLDTIVEKVCLFSQSKIRIIRFAFTYIALGLFKSVLSNYSDISSLVTRRES